MKTSEEENQKKICQVLDQSVAELDSDTLKRLQQGRASALERWEPKRRGYWKPLWGGLPGLAVLLIIGLIAWPDSDTSQIHVPDLVELNLLTSTQSLDFYAQDIEFYLWLAETMEANPANRGALPDASSAERESAGTAG